MNIMVVDDQTDVRKMLCDILERDGHTTYEAENGRQALDLLKFYHVDLIVTDIVMPEIEGTEFILRLRQSGIPIVAISGLSREAVIASFLESLGIVGFLKKPFDIKSLHSIIEVVEKDESRAVLRDAKKVAGKSNSRTQL